MTTVELPVIDETTLDADHDHVLVHLYYKWNQLMAVCGVSVLTTSTKAASTVGFCGRRGCWTALGVEPRSA